MAEAVSQGTTYLETKTGYGLDVENEARSARIASTVVDEATYLGAHLVPAGIDAEEYTELVCGPMLAAVRPYVRWADVFCERGAFDEAQSRRVLQACQDADWAFGSTATSSVKDPVSGSPWNSAPPAWTTSTTCPPPTSTPSRPAGPAGTAAAVVGAGRGTVATCLPACDLSTRQPLAPGRELLDAGVQLALASNCNPGTSYTSSMAFCVTTAVLQMRLSVHEAVRAATYGGALALGRESGNDADGERAVGSIAVGHRADLHLLNAPSATHLAYRPGIPLTHAVWRAGVRAR